MFGKVQLLMKKLSFNVLAALMRWRSPLCAKTTNVTRRSFTFQILKSFEQLRLTIPKIEGNDVLRLLLDLGNDSEKDTFVKRLSNFESAAKILQKDSVTFADARTIFDIVLKKYERLHGPVGTRPSIIQNKAFEMSRENLQRGD